MDKKAKDIGAELQNRLLEHIQDWRVELKTLLPALPDDIEAVFDNRWLISITGTGGFALSKRQIALAFDPDFKGDKSKQLNDFKGSYFHESYHIVQGYTGEDTKGKQLSALANSIYEGAATVFERDRAGTDPLWGKYEVRATMLNWVSEVRGLPQDYDWQKYKFYDPWTDRRWTLYKTGTFIVDEVLKQNGELKIEDLATKSPEEILVYSQLA